MKQTKAITIASYIIILTFLLMMCQIKSIKSLIIGSSINSLKHQYIARCFFSERTIKDTLEKNKVCELKNNYINIIDFGEIKYEDKDIDIFKISKLNLKGYVALVYNPLSIKVGYSKYLPNMGETTSSIAKRNNAIIAINAGGFGYFSEKQLNPMGVVIHNGEIIYNELNDDNKKQDIVGFTKDGMLIVGKHSINELRDVGIKEAVTFGPPLIVNGKKVTIKGDGGWGIAPRTAIGQRENGTVILMTLRGKNLERAGATIKDVQDEMIKYKAINAVNLDGGNSATMFYGGNVLNKKESKEIKVPTIIFVEK